MSNKAWFSAMVGQGYTARAVTFDGTNDYLTRGADFTSNADSKVGIFSCWLKFNAGSDNNTIYLMNSNTARVSFNRLNNNTMSFELVDGSGYVLNLYTYSIH